MVFKRLVLLSIVSVNAGYTLFLFPVLGLLYPSRVPLTLSNLLAFVTTNTLWGILLAVVVYLVVRLTGVSLPRAITWSILMLWISFWLIPLLAGIDKLPLGLDDAVVVCIDGGAAILSMMVMLKLVKRYIL